MLRVVQRCTRSAFGIGIVIGLSISMLLSEPLARAAAAPPLLDQPDICEEMPPGLPEDVQDMITTQCEVHAAIFADQIEPSFVYGFPGPMPQPGTWTGHDYLNRQVEFHADWTMPLNLRDLAPDLWARGIEVYIVVGALSGPAGAAHVSALEIKTGDLSLDQEYLLFVTEVVTQQRSDEFKAISRIQAGPRVMDPATAQFYSIDEAPFVPIWSSAADLSTLYITNGGSPVGSGCLNNAFANYNLCMQTAQTNLESCMIDVILDWSICMGFCAAGSLLLPVTTILVGLCVAACFAYAARQTASCLRNYSNAADACKQQLILDVRACGANIVAI